MGPINLPSGKEIIVAIVFVCVIFLGLGAWVSSALSDRSREEDLNHEAVNIAFDRAHLAKTSMQYHMYLVDLYAFMHNNAADITDVKEAFGTSSTLESHLNRVMQAENHDETIAAHRAFLEELNARLLHARKSVVKRDTGKDLLIFPKVGKPCGSNLYPNGHPLDPCV